MQLLDYNLGVRSKGSVENGWTEAKCRKYRCYKKKYYFYRHQQISITKSRGMKIVGVLVLIWTENSN